MGMLFLGLLLTLISHYIVNDLFYLLNQFFYIFGWLMIYESISSLIFFNIKTMYQNKKYNKLTKSKIVFDYPTTEYDYTLVCFDAKEAVFDAIYDNLNKLLNDYEAAKGIIPINVCAHCGPGSIGISVSPKINGKSLKEFI